MTKLPPDDKPEPKQWVSAGRDAHVTGRDKHQRTSVSIFSGNLIVALGVISLGVIAWLLFRIQQGPNKIEFQLQNQNQQQPSMPTPSPTISPKKG